MAQRTYGDGDIVWVKLGNLWWPGEVCGANRLPDGLLESMRKEPIAVVKFFQENTYEYVKNISDIYNYHCHRKHEFIKKGLDLYRSNMTYVEKFPDDVSTAEQRTHGNPNIISSNEFAPVEKPDIAQIFGTGSKKGAKYSASKNVTPVRGRAAAAKKPIVPKSPVPSLTPSPSQSNINQRILTKSDHVSRILGSSTQTHTSSSGDIEPKYKCPFCNFNTSRLNIIVLHTKSHSGGSFKAKGSVLPATKRVPPVLQPIKQIFSCVTSDNAENSSSDDDDDDDAATTTTTSDSMASTSNISLAEPSGSGNLTTEQPQKLPKKQKTEIKSTLLADWSDEDDNAHSENMPSTSSNSTINIHPQSTQPITVAADSTVSEKPKYRNIPKKDRRDVILDKFLNTPSTSAAVLASNSSTVVGNVIVIDTDESDDEKTDNATGSPKQLKNTAGKRTKAKSIDINESNETPIASEKSDDHVLLKPHKKREVAKVRLELSPISDLITECDLVKKSLENVAVITKTRDSIIELIDKNDVSHAVVSQSEEIFLEFEKKSTKDIVSSSLTEDPVVIPEQKSVTLKRRGLRNRRNIDKAEVSSPVTVTSQRRGRSGVGLQETNSIHVKDTAKAKTSSQIDVLLSTSSGNVIEEPTSSDKVELRIVEPCQPEDTEILEPEKSVAASPAKTDQSPGNEFSMPAETVVTNEVFESKTDAETIPFKEKEQIEVKPIETSRRRVTRSAKEVEQPAYPPTVSDTKTDTLADEIPAKKSTQTTSKTSRKGKQPRRREELVTIVPAIAATVEPEVKIHFHVQESLEIPQSKIQEEDLELKKSDKSNSDAEAHNADDLGVQIDTTVDNTPDSQKESAAIEQPTTAHVAPETQFDILPIEPSTSSFSELPENQVEQADVDVSNPIICEIQDVLTETVAPLPETSVEDRPSRSSSKRSRKEKVPVKRNTRSEPVDQTLESKEVLEYHPPQVVSNVTSDETVETSSDHQRRKPIDTETPELSHIPRRSSRCSRPSVMSPSEEQLVEIVKEIDEKCAETDLKSITPDVHVAELQPESLADTSQLNESDEITDPSPDKSTDTSKDIDCFTFTEEEEEEIPKVLKRRKRRQLTAGKVFELFSIDKIEEQRRQEEEDALRLEKEESHRKLQQEINDLLSSADVPIPQSYTPVKKINEPFSERANEKNPHEKDKKRIFKSRYTPLKSDINNVGEATSTASADATAESIDSSFESLETPQAIPKSPTPVSVESHASADLDPKPSSLENVFREAVKNDEKRTRKIKSRDTIEQRFSDDKSPTDIDTITTNCPSESDLQIAETLINLPLLNSSKTQMPIVRNVNVSSKKRDFDTVTSVDVIPSKITKVEDTGNASSVDVIQTKRPHHTEASELILAKRACPMTPYRSNSSEENGSVVFQPLEITLKSSTAIPSESIVTVVEAITISSSATILPCTANLNNVRSEQQDIANNLKSVPDINIDIPASDVANTHSSGSDGEVQPLLSTSFNKTCTINIANTHTSGSDGEVQPLLLTSTNKTSKIKQRSSINKQTPKEHRRSVSVASKIPTFNTPSSNTGPEQTVTPKSYTKAYTAPSQMVTVNSSQSRVVDSKMIIKPALSPSNAVTVTTTLTTTALTTNYPASIAAGQAVATQQRLQTTTFPTACTSTTISATKSICMAPSVTTTTKTPKTPRKPAPKRKTPSTRVPDNTEGLTTRHVGYDGHGRDIVVYDTTPVLTTVSQSNNSQFLITSKGGLISSHTLNPRPSFNTADTTTSSMIQAMSNPLVSTISSPTKIQVQSNRLVPMTTAHARPTTSPSTLHKHSQPAQTAKRKLATKRKASSRKSNPPYTISHSTQQKQPSAENVDKQIRSMNDSKAVTRDVAKVSTSKLGEFERMGIIKDIESEKFVNKNDFDCVQNSEKPTAKKTIVRRVSRTIGVSSTIVQESSADAQPPQAMPPLALISDQTLSPQCKQTSASPPQLLITSEEQQPIVEAVVQQFEPPASPTQSNCSSDDPAKDRGASSSGIVGIPAVQFGGPANSYYLCRIAPTGEIEQIDGRAMYLGSGNQLIPFSTDQELDETTIIDECELQQHQFLEAADLAENVEEDEEGATSYMFNTVDGQRIILDQQAILALAAAGNENPEFVNIDGEKIVLQTTPQEILSAMGLTDEIVNGLLTGQQCADEEYPVLQQEETDQEILVAALDCSDVYAHQEQFMGTENVVLTTEQAGLIYQHVLQVEQAAVEAGQPQLTNKTNETNAIGHMPIMSTLEQPTAKGVDALLDSGAGALCIDESLAVIGVTCGNNTNVPTSLELPITITNPAIAQQTTCNNPISLSSIYPSTASGSVALMTSGQIMTAIPSTGESVSGGSNAAGGEHLVNYDVFGTQLQHHHFAEVSMAMIVNQQQRHSDESAIGGIPQLVEVVNADGLDLDSSSDIVPESVSGNHVDASPDMDGFDSENSNSSNEIPLQSNLVLPANTYEHNLNNHHHHVLQNHSDHNDQLNEQQHYINNGNVLVVQDDEDTSPGFTDAHEYIEEQQILVGSGSNDVSVDNFNDDDYNNRYCPVYEIV